MNQSSPARIAQMRALASEGATLREIATKVGCSKCTVMRYVGPLDRSAGLRRHHERRKAEGRPIVPPWAKSQPFDPLTVPADPADLRAWARRLVPAEVEAMANAICGETCTTDELDAVYVDFVASWCPVNLPEWYLIQIRGDDY